ncbi:trypsin-like peptidase domain-containing protein [Alistipes sp. OttesenSCG-928-B03]|nr:trypsin-like peptidase domain-containing protein [Alistipes sp. OttesenSCG-928-B03]
MKRSQFFIGVAAASLLVAGVTAFAVTKLTNRGDAPAVERVAVEFADKGGAGTHFAAWSAAEFPDLTYAAENAVEAVVNIEKTEERRGSSRSQGYNPFFEFFGFPEGAYGQPQTREVRSGGSGVIISPDGYIVTNNHVIENASKLKIKLYDGRIFEGTIVGTDPGTDIGLVKIDAQDLPTLPFGDSDELRLGEWVLAIGSPFDLQSTITAGIVSAKARNLSSANDKMDIQSFIQTDAAVNPGNSGGALVNTRGQLVGINTALTSPTGTFAGYSFAVPVSIVQKVVIDLREYGIVQRAMIGIGYNVIDDHFIEARPELGIAEPGGLYVGTVDPDGGAAAAGVKVGDVVTAINGIRTDNSGALLEEVARHRPNDKVILSVKRDGKVKQIEVVLRNKAGKAELVTKDTVYAADALGGSFAELSDKEARDLKIDGGLRVREVHEGGVLSRARIRRGFVITHINEKPVRSVGDLNKISSKIESIDGVYPGRGQVGYVIVE